MESPALISRDGSKQRQRERKLHMIGNAHIDPVWLWPWQEGLHEVRATFYSALQLMKENDDFLFVSSSAAFYEWIEEIDPQMFAEIRQRVQEGRWELAGGWWIQPDCNIPAGESYVRQALYGQRYFNEKFGRTARVGYNVDSFGHNAMLPQILKKSGLDYYAFLRPMPHEKGLPGRLFRWEADDGSQVIAFRIPFEYCTWGKGLEQHIQRCAGEIKSPAQELMCFYGVGNHGGGPTRENLESIRELMGSFEGASLEFSTPQRYFETLEARGLALPVVHDELQRHASGCYAAHSGVKRWNRRAENALLSAEKFSAIAAWATGHPYPDEFGRAWKNVLFNQFHDILAGTSLEQAYEDARDTYGEAMAIAGRAQNSAIQALSWQIGIQAEEGSRPLVVFNPHAWAAKMNVELEMSAVKEGEVLLDAGGQPVPFQRVQPAATAGGRSRISFVADLPALGYSLFRLAKRPEIVQPEPLPAGDTFLENDRLRLEFDPETGWLKSLWDKRLDAELLGGPAARPVVLDDPSDTWSHDVFRFDRECGAFTARSVRLVENGPVRSVVRVTSEWGRSQVVQDFILYRDLEGVEVRVMVDWRERSKALKLRFPVKIVFQRATYEIPYGSLERYTGGDEEPGQSWLDVSGILRETGMTAGLSLINDGKYSFDVQIRDIGMTVLRSPVYANHLPMIPVHDGHYSYIDQGIQRFSYLLLPHPGSWEGAGTVRRAAELNQPAVALVATFHPGPLPVRDSFLQVDAENIQVTVLKQAEDGGGLVLRAYETCKQATRVEFSLPRWGRAFQAEFGPAEIKTFFIPAEAEEPVAETNLLEWPAE